MRNTSIRTKLLAITIIPLVALTAIAVQNIADRRATLAEALAAADHAERVALAQQVVVDLYDERDRSAWYLAAGGSDSLRTDMLVARSEVDTAMEAFKASHPAGDPVLADIDASAEQMISDREAVDAETMGVGESLSAYDASVEHMVEWMERVEASSDGLVQVRSALAHHRVANDLADAASRERAILTAAFTVDRFDASQYQDFLGSLFEQDQARSVLDADPSLPGEVSDALGVVGAQEASADFIREIAYGRPDGLALGQDPASWFDMASSRVDARTGVTTATVASLMQASDAAVESARREQVLFTAGAIGSAIFGLILLAVVTRTVISPLRRLTADAAEVAEYRLPSAVAQIASGEREAEELPANAASSRGDEFGALGRALDEVQGTALSLAGDQAAARRGVSETFANLGRRNQSLLGRQLDLIENLEESEVDPDTLQSLFRLDHLATRMRRNAESLLVLAGDEPRRRWTEPLPVDDVVRAAIGEVEDYERVMIHSLDHAHVAGAAASDVAHLLAELLENGLNFSPPDSQVAVVGKSLANGYRITVVDQGIGIRPDDLPVVNERLRSPSEDAISSRYLGLHVVARLAARHGVGVVLDESGTGGVTARVDLPATLVGASATPRTEAPQAVAPDVHAGRAAHEPPSMFAPAPEVSERLRDESSWAGLGGSAPTVPEQPLPETSRAGAPAGPNDTTHDDLVAPSIGAAVTVPVADPAPGSEPGSVGPTPGRGEEHIASNEAPATDPFDRPLAPTAGVLGAPPPPSPPRPTELDAPGVDAPAVSDAWGVPSPEPLQPEAASDWPGASEHTGAPTVGPPGGSSQIASTATGETPSGASATGGAWAVTPPAPALSPDPAPAPAAPSVGLPSVSPAEPGTVAPPSPSTPDDFGLGSPAPTAPAPAPADAAPAAPAAADSPFAPQPPTPATTPGGLTKRRRGSHTAVTPGANDTASRKSQPRSAEEVRDRLSRFSSGVRRGHAESTTSPTEES